ncbi:MAG TPA: ABC transporter substrate-binding protein [Candidatus Binatia bacterium]|nr:ABC transporter substrate-binding protein [Candidatus Binatia bacterium]
MKQFWIFDPSAGLRTGFGFLIGESKSKKVFCLALCTMILALSFRLEAQQTKKIARIAVLGGASASALLTSVESFRQGLRELGYVEGKNIVIEYRYAEGKRERWSVLAQEIALLKPDVIVMSGTGFIRTVKQVTSTIPIVVAGAGDLVETGVVESLARPGGNVTGTTNISSDLSGKRLELLKEVVPKALRVAIFWRTAPDSQDEDEVKRTQVSATPLGIKIQPVPVRSTDEFQGAFAAIKKENANALIIVHGTWTNSYRRELVELAAKNRLPTMCETVYWTEDGCLMNYGHDPRYGWRRAAVFADKILKGARPADLPVEQPMKFEFIINLKTAKQIGVTIPPNVMARANRIIR